MKITALTLTGDRPEAFALCQKWMERQTRQPDQWIVMDDGAIPAVLTSRPEYVYCPELAGAASLPRKVAKAMDENLIKGDVLTFFEDDDYYYPDFFELIAQKMERADVYGEGWAIYYNVRTRHWFDNGNYCHASLCQTAIAKEFFPVLLELARDPHFQLDGRLWPKAQRPKVFDPRKGARSCIGIKSMPGRPGYMTIWHQNVFGAFDPDLSALRRLIGSDADCYAPFYQPQKKLDNSLEKSIVSP
jgi:hypothetical protein